MKRRHFLVGSAALAAASRKAQSQAANPILTPPGSVIAHSPAGTRRFLGSPSLAILPDGTYVASHDDFGPGGAKNQTWIYQSRDKGTTWQLLAEVPNQYWSTLFGHRGALYIVGTTREYGFLVIRRSEDGGKTWSASTDENTGLLRADGKYHCAPVPVVFQDGRIYRAFEDAQGPGGWGSHFRSFVISAPDDADLLRRENWTFSNALARDPAWLNGKFGGWLEGNAVAAPGGGIVNILRVDYRSREEKAALQTLSADGKTLNFDAQSGFIEFPGGAKKFTIRRDDKGDYWTLSNWIAPSEVVTNIERTRNTLALAHSTDLKNWEVRAVLLHHADNLRHGFQYADWHFDGDDIIAVVRTASDDETGGAPNCHDSNFITFHRFAGFRALKLGDA